MNYLLLIIIGAVGIWIGKKMAASKNPPIVEAEIVDSKVTDSRVVEKENSKDRILIFLRENGKVTNNDVEKLLEVSDATATRYLSELESEDKIKQIGITGKSVYYTL